MRGGCQIIALLFVTFQCRPAPVADPVVYVDFAKSNHGLILSHGLTVVTGRFGAALEFTTPLQTAELPFTGKLDKVQAATVGGWFFPRRSGEQYFVARGIPDIGQNGERFFRRQDNWVNFVLGTDQRGFFLGTINGNSMMPFPLVTLEEVPIDSWSQLVAVKTADGFQKFYRNGTLVHSDSNSVNAPKIWPFNDTAEGEPLRLMMPLGGMIGEAWAYARELSAEEIRADYFAKTNRYFPSLAATPVLLREMNSHPAAGLWREPIDKQRWPTIRHRLFNGATNVLGAFPPERASLDPKMMGEVDCGSYLRRKISIQVQPGDRMPFYLLVPKNVNGRVPAVICFYGTSSGAGKDTTVGISGRAPGSKPHPNMAFAVDMVEAGFVAVAPDYLRDGERINPGRRPYDTTDFYNEFPDWSIHGKDIWDTSRTIDYLETLNFVDAKKIGMAGHSYGGHSTIFATALEPRIQVAVANGPVSDFRHHGMHWAVPKGGGNSQSLPAMRPYVLDPTLQIPMTFYEFTALIAPRPLLVGQAVGERRPMEEENYAAVKAAYDALGYPERVRYHWYAGDHDFPPEARQAAINWFKRWFNEKN
jgi:dienelactone hydrolase